MRIKLTEEAVELINNFKNELLKSSDEDSLELVTTLNTYTGVNRDFIDTDIMIRIEFFVPKSFIEVE